MYFLPTVEQHSQIPNGLIWNWVRLLPDFVFWPALFLRANWLQYSFLQWDTAHTLLKNIKRFHADLQHWPFSAWHYSETFTLSLKFGDIWPVLKLQWLLPYLHAASIWLTSTRPQSREQKLLLKALFCEAQESNLNYPGYCHKEADGTKTRSQLSWAPAWGLYKKARIKLWSMKLQSFSTLQENTHTKTCTQSTQSYRASDILDNVLLYDRGTCSAFKELR